MSFTTDSSDKTISFRPATLHINWDGVSEAKASFELSCFDGAASYSAVAYPAFTASGSVSAGPTSSPVIYKWNRGDRIFTVTYDGTSPPFRTFLPNVSIPTTVTSGTATLRFSAITATTFVHAWQLSGTKGTVTRVLVAGGVFPNMPSPYSSGSFVGGITASGCF